MQRAFSIFSSLLLLTAGSFPSPLEALPSASTVTETPEGKPVGRIDVFAENLPSDASFDARPVLAKMETKVGTPFSHFTFDADLKTLSDEYDRIEPSVQLEGGEVYITLRVWPRPMIRAIQWEGNQEFKSKTLQKELDIEPGQTFNRTLFNKAFHKVKEYYLKKGYFESELSYAVTTDPKTNLVDITVTVREGRAGIIDQIIFEGFSSEEKSELLDMIYTKKYNFFISWIMGTGLYNEEAVEQDKLTVANFLQNEGYADAQVDIQVKESEKKGKITLTISTVKGPLFHFRSVTFKGNKLFTDAEIEKQFLIHPEEVYSPEKLRATMQSIKDLYGRKGYIETSVQYETQLVEDQPLYDAHFDIEEGERYKIGLIHVFGNVQTQTSVILRESLLVPGETFDSLRLKKTEERLRNIGYFKSVNVYAVRTQDDQIGQENYRDVYIEVEETSTGHAAVFFGASSSDSVFGGLNITESNFNYKGFGKFFKDGPSALRGGGEYAHLKAQLGKKINSYTMSWMTPYFRDTLWRVGFDSFITQSNLQAKRYKIDSVGGSLFASYPFNAYWSFGWKYRIKHAKIDPKHDAPHKEKETRKGSGNISATGAALNFDSTDNIMKPHMGFRSSLEAEFAGIGGDFSFMKYNYLNAYYQSLWKKGIMKYRWEFRFIQPILWTHDPVSIPVSERFFLGGETSVRGYVPFDIGDHFSDGDPIGGITSGLLSVEYLQEIFSFLDVFVFIDAGSIKLKQFEFGQYKMSTGFGVRLEILNRIPITVGYGFPINPDNEKQVQRLYFTMGAQF